MKNIFLSLLLIASCSMAPEDKFWERDKSSIQIVGTDFDGYVRALKRLVPMYDPAKVHLYYEQYSKEENEKVYECTEACLDGGSCQTGAFGEIIRQPASGKVFMRYPADMSINGQEAGMIKLFQKKSDNKFYFARIPETDEEQIIFDGDKATYGIEGYYQNCRTAPR
jgi:hypothetical protein